MFGVYITHPQVNISPDIPVPEWGLSDLGIERTRQAALLPWVRQLRRIVSSAETKAVQTAAILAEALAIEPEVDASMHENDRSATGFLPPPAFEEAADWFFAHPHESYHGWERAVDAQARIVEAVGQVLADHDRQQPIAFVGHGGVGTLLRCHLAGEPIARSRDQPGGGGNLFCFSLGASSGRSATVSLADCRLSCDWTPIESWQGDKT